mgnify:CR=1 FL=1
MKIKFLFFTTVISILFISACEEQINITQKQFDEALVVDGTITNDPGPYTVKISYTSKVNNSEFRPYSGCVVTIFEQSGESEILSEVEPGVYKTAENGIQGEVGKSYSIDIQTPDGKTYISDYQEIKAPVGIDSVYAKLEFEENPGATQDVPGYQFYMSTEPTPEDVFLLWEMEETYEYTADYQLVQTMYEGVINKNHNPDTNYRCWNTQPVKEIFTEQTVTLSSSGIRDKALHFVNTLSKKLQYRYSLLVKQMVINEDAYSYWNQVKSQMSSDDFLFSKQPYRIKGNVYNPENPQDMVLGYFTAGSVKKRRIFVNSPSVRLNYDKCAVNFDLRFMYAISWRKKVYFVYGEEGMGMVGEGCVDCRSEGGKLEKPEFWNN